MEVKKGIEQASQKLLEYLESKRKFLQTEKDIHDLAMITTNGNTEVSDIVAKALIEAGSKIVVNIEESPTGLHELKVRINF